MLNSINTIQNKESFENFINYDYIESLVNAGQRMGVAGHAVKYASATIFDIVEAGVTKQDVTNYSLMIEYNNSLFNCYKVNNKDINDKQLLGNIADNRILSGDQTIIKQLLDKLLILNRIEAIKDDYILHSDDNVLTFIFKAKVLNTDDEAELYYIQYDVIENVILHFIQIRKYDDIYGVVFNLRNDNTDNKYKVDIYKFKYLLDTGKDDLGSYIQNCYQSTNSFNIGSIFSYGDKDASADEFTIINKNFINYDNLISDTYIYNQPTLLQFIVNFNQDTISEENNTVYKIYKYTDISLEFNKNNKLVFSLKDTDLTDNEIATINQLKGITGVDINYLYEFVYYSSVFYIIYELLLKTYNEFYYLSSKEQLFYAIIRQLYNTIYNSYSASGTTQLYIPGSYVFNYMCNNNNEMNIYYFNAFNVLYINNLDNLVVDEDKNLDGLLNNQFILYYDVNNDSKIVSYNVNIQYNDNFEDIIRLILVNKIYTYPYIDKFDNWIINDENSEISSYNNLDSIHKILILYCDTINDDNSSNLNVVHLINPKSEEDLQKFTYRLKTFNINPKYCSITNNSIKCTTCVPTVTVANFDYFEKTLLLIITNKNNIVETAGQSYVAEYEGKYVYSLWKINEYDNSSAVTQFECIMDPVTNNYALDPFGYILEHKEKNNNVLYTNAKTNLVAQDPYNISGSNYVVLRNKDGNKYDNEYNNDFNFIIEYVNSLQESAENVDYTNMRKYVPSLSEITLSNVRYPRYTRLVDVIKNRIKTTVNVSEVVDSINTDTDIYIDDGGNIITEEYIKKSSKYIERLFTQYTDQYTTMETLKVEKSSNIYYDEYLPNTNVPIFDSKEIFHDNMNVLNRVNILGLSIDKNNNNVWYNGFFGTYFDGLTNKSVLGISTNVTNINIGTDTLMDKNVVANLKKYDTFKISDFNNIVFNADSSIETNQIISNKLNIGETSYTTKSLIPVGYLFDHYTDDVDNNKLYIIKERNNTKLSLAVNNNNFIRSLRLSTLNSDPTTLPMFVKLYYRDDNIDTTYKYISNCLYLNNFMDVNFGINIDYYDFSQLNVGNNIIFKISGSNVTDPKYYFMLLNTNDFTEIDGLCILNNRLNVMTINNILNIRFDDYILNEPKFNNYANDLTASYYTDFWNLLTRNYNDISSETTYNDWIYSEKYINKTPIDINIS